MDIKLFLGVAILVAAVAGCGMLGGGDNANLANAGNGSSASAEQNKKEPDKKAEFTGEMKFPFDFPAVDTTAKTGEHVLVPSYNWLVEAMEKPDQQTFIWYAQKMSKPGAERSEVQFMSDKKEVPNAYIVPIAPGAKAKNGDIVLTWWQTGSGMQRAIVTDASDPAQPVVRYLDLDYDNPAKSRDGKTTIGQMDEKIKPDTFVVIKGEMEPGTGIAITDGANLKHGIVIKRTGDKVFAKLFAGKAGVFPKSSVKSIPLVPNVKAGDRIKALRFAGLEDATVSRVDAKIGRVFVKFDGSNDEKAIAFGNVMPK